MPLLIVKFEGSVLQKIPTNAGSITIGVVGLWLPLAGSTVTAKPLASMPAVLSLWKIMPLPLPSGLNHPAAIGALPSAGSSQSS